MKIAASIMFDSSYVESALVTAYEVSRHSELFDTVHLIYLDRGKEDDAAVQALLANFVDTCSDVVRLNPIVVANTLPAFVRNHFNNSIVYKALIPSMLPTTEKFVLNLDAGILLGNAFEDYVNRMMDTLCRPDADWVIAANTGDAQSLLTPAQRSLPHDPAYPYGAVLLFNTQRYHASDWHARYLDAYSRLHHLLRFAEQDLICLVAQPGEIAGMPIKDPLKFHFLSEKVLLGDEAPLPADYADDSIHVKFAGSIKPWKYWVLDPDKAIYTRRRRRLEQVFPIAGHQVIETERYSCLDHQWAAQFLMAYDARLVGSSPLAA